MNEKIVYEMIKPYIKNNTITYKVFLKLFYFLRKPDQYKVINLIEDKFKIHVNDDELQDSVSGSHDVQTTAFSEEDAEESVILPDMLDVDEDTDDEFEELYDKGVFSNDNYAQRSGINLRQSNETLCRLIQEGDELAKEELCIKNRRLVYKYAFAYNKYYNHKLDIQDLVQVGFLGMLIGAERFDFSKGTQFSTYVVWWIKQQISREIMNNGYTIRYPVHVFEMINKLDRVEKQLQNDLKNTESISVEMLAEALGMETSKVRDLKALKDQLKSMPSLDVNVGEDSDTPLWELIEDTMVEPTEKLSEKIAIYEIFDKALSELSPREEKVIRLRMGFDDGQNRTLEEVGQILGVTRERIRQIEAKGLRKLSHRLKQKDLYMFFEE